MAGMSNYLEGAIIDHIFRNIGYSMPSDLFIALLTTTPVDTDVGVEVSTSGTGYIRQSLPPAPFNWEAATASGITSNKVAITFPQALASWGVIAGVGIFDAVTSGNLLFYGALTTSRTVNTGDIYQFGINQLQVQIDN